MPPPTALIFDLVRKAWLSFSEPIRILTAHSLAEVRPALAEADRAVREHQLWAAGWVAYEAAPAFDPAMTTFPPGDFPLAWLGLFPPPEEVDLPPGTGPAPAVAWSPDLGEAEYIRRIAAIKEEIAAGNTYQVNYTLRMHGRLPGDAWAFFVDLAQRQAGGPAAWLDAGRFKVCSASPELFFELDGDRLRSRPMKGTQHRGLTPDADREQAAWLAASEKNRAENLMIVDMVRNDMGRIAASGTVEVPALFEIERYPTVLQMTSTVASRTDASVPEIFAALFPCASITGAPKIRTMSIIRSLENGPRGVYTGAVGWWGPDRQAQFSVAIRTAVVDRETGVAEYGTGSGIVWDSAAADEYRECLLKTRVLDERRPDFELLETLRADPGAGIFLLERHLARLADSADYFGFYCDLAAVRRALSESSGVQQPTRLRLLLTRAGSFRVESAVLERDVRSPAGLMDPDPRAAAVRGVLAPGPVARDNVTLYHKTTDRVVYAAAEAARPGAEQVLLWNEMGEATEFTRANLVAQLDGQLVTPPVSCGLLGGVLRAELLARGVVQERVIRLDELADANGIWALNSVRGWVGVRISESALTR